ncbi:MAG: hypothetical protein U9O94_07360, partial [Nanoarchaeota archaeon]|nr:hypothetical protein [Nanoarchaeota archaeon]
RSSFQRKGAYGTRKAIFEQHVNPLVEHVHSQKQQAAQESLNTYLSDAETRGQVESHLETRTGRKLNKGNYLTLQEAFNVIATYMQQPDADKIIGKKDAQVKLGDDTVGRPELYKIFDGGETFHKKYQDISNVIDAQHRFGGKKDDKKPEKRTGTYD